ncbi:MAG: hypothetical protein H0U08_00845 [Actinobacteria bacterium]|nr:hypothetical protein [Actinomycetota bacterium]
MPDRHTGTAAAKFHGEWDILSGILVVTDRRVAFFMGGMLWRRRCVVAAPYAEIAGVDVLDSPHTKWAVVVVATLTELWSDWRLKFDLSARRPRAEEVASMIQLQKKLESTAAHDPPDSWSDRIEFESIKGGRPRAEEITRAIVRQKLLLERGADSASGELDRANETANEDSDVQEVIGALPRVSVGRGVSVWVEVRGGRLYVWGEPLGSAFDRMEASVRRPEGVEFVACDAVTEFELHVEAGMRWTRPIHLGRRWFGLRDGIEVSTGLGMGQGGV